MKKEMKLDIVKVCGEILPESKYDKYFWDEYTKKI